MQLKQPTIIALIISFVALIAFGFLMYFSEEENLLAVNSESLEFRELRDQAQIAHTTKRYEEAVLAYREALRMRPENAEVHNDLGATYYEMALDRAGPNWPSWEETLTAYTPDQAIKAFEIATTEVKSGFLVFTCDTPESAQAIQSVAKTAGDHVSLDLYGEGAIINVLIGETKEYILNARNAYLMAIDAKPTYNPAYRNLGSLYIKIGQLDVGKDHLENAFQLDPRDEELRQYLNQLQ